MEYFMKVGFTGSRIFNEDDFSQLRMLTIADQNLIMHAKITIYKDVVLLKMTTA